MMTFGIRDTLDFGKYRGETVAAIIERDPWYMKWFVSQGNRLSHEADVDLTIALKTMKRPEPANKKPFPPLGFESKMPFGRHAGKTIRAMLDAAPKSLAWYLRNTSIRVTAEVENELLKKLRNENE